MAGIDRILDRIAADGKSEAEAKLAQARSRAEEIRRSNARAAEELKQDLVKKSEAEASARYDRLIGMAHTEARKQLLSVKQELIETAFAKTVTELAAQSEEDKVTLLSRLAAQASISGEEELILTPADHSRFGKRVLEGATEALTAAGKTAKLRLSASPRALEGSGGIVLRDGDVEINCSYGALISAVRDELTPEVARILFA